AETPSPCREMPCPRHLASRGASPRSLSTDVHVERAANNWRPASGHVTQPQGRAAAYKHGHTPLREWRRRMRSRRGWHGAGVQLAAGGGGSPPDNHGGPAGPGPGARMSWRARHPSRRWHVGPLYELIRTMGAATLALPAGSAILAPPDCRTIPAGV